MVAHLILTITLLLSRDENVRACLPLDHTRAEFERKDVELATGLGAAIGLLIIEFMGFLSGLSMFGAPSVIHQLFLVEGLLWNLGSPRTAA